LNEDAPLLNPQDMLIEAEKALSEGRFIKARRYTSKARGILERTQELHRKFMNRLKEATDRIRDMEEKGYDVTEAWKIVERSKEKATRSRYEVAISSIDAVDPALERATYLPFPLLNRNVDIISVITYSSDQLQYSVRIENPTTEPLGEIIIRPFLQEGMFQEVPERQYGLVNALSYKESTFLIKPRVKDWNVGIDKEVLTGEGVVLRTKLSSRGGTARYTITVENNSDEILRDITVGPMAPGGLKPIPEQGLIEYVEPFASRSIEFDLEPASLDREVLDTEKVVVVDEEVLLEDEEEYEDDNEEEEEEDEADLEMDGEEEEDEADLEMDGEGEGEALLEGLEAGVGTPSDFTPVRPEYNLISMAPNAFPRSVLKEMKRRKKGPARGKAV